MCLSLLRGGFQWVLLAVTIALAVLAFPVGWLWNALLPDLFALPALTTHQTFLLMALWRVFTFTPNIELKVRDHR